MRGAKKILIFSEAGGTGRSYHASLTAQNQSRRNHYLLEPVGARTLPSRASVGPTASGIGAAVQAGLDRLPRRASPHLNDRPAARQPGRADPRPTANRRAGLFDPRDNLESEYAKESLEQWFGVLAAGKLRSTTLAEFQRLTGLELEGEGGVPRTTCRRSSAGSIASWRCASPCRTRSSMNILD